MNGTARIALSCCSALLVLAGCEDERLPMTPAGGANTPAVAALGALACATDVRAGTLACAPPAPDATLPPGASGLIVGGQHTFVALASSNVCYETGCAGGDPGDDIFQADVTVRNIIAQALATADGSTGHSEGVRVFFTAPPAVTGCVGGGTSCGSVMVGNPDSHATFTAPMQPFFQYGGFVGDQLGADGLLVQWETSAPRTWQWIVPDGVAGFEFTVYVSAALRYPDGWVDVDAAALGLALGASHGFTATPRDVVGAPAAGETVSWASSDPAIVSIDPATGEATAAGAGTATLTVTSDNALREPGTVEVTVDDAVFASGDESALTFDGVDDSIEADGVAAAMAGGSGAVTIEAWSRVAPGTTSGNHVIASFGTATGGNHSIIGYDATRQKYFYYDGWVTFKYTTGTFAPGTWHHVALVRSGGTYNIYVDGVEQVPQPSQFTGTDAPAADGQFSIGQEYDGSSASDLWAGELDEVRVWHAGLSAATIRHWMDRALTDAHPGDAFLVAHFPFDEGSGTTVTDRSGNGITGSFTGGGPAWSAEGIALRASDVLLVDDDAAGHATGATWEHAYPTLQDALAVALPGDEIWVAAGTYHPDEGGAEMPDDQGAAFHLLDDVTILGGFAGTESARSERDPDPATNETVLSGDIDGDGTPAGNSNHVVDGEGVGPTAVLDGVTVTGGNAVVIGHDLHGGGLYIRTGSPTLRHVVVRGNAAQDFGGGAYVLGGSPTFTDVVFENNTSGAGGGGLYNGGTVTIVGATFLANSSGLGGGLYNHFGAGTLVDVRFIGNEAVTGGAIVHGPDPGPEPSRFTNVIFAGNSASGDGGAIWNGRSPTFVNVTFVGNAAGSGTGDHGGAIYDTGGATITNAIVWGNTAGGSGAQIHDAGGSPVVSYSTIEGGYAGTGNLPLDPLLVEMPAPGADGVWGTADDEGDLRLQPGSPAIDTGNDTAVQRGTTTDLDGNPRAVDGDGDATATVDMGAYERQGGMLSAGRLHDPVDDELPYIELVADAALDPLRRGTDAERDEGCCGGRSPRIERAEHESWARNARRGRERRRVRAGSRRATS